MNKGKLAITLSKLKTFEKPKQNLEQYPTDSETAAEILWHAYMNNDIKGKVIADFGCGTGILGIGALLLEAKQVYFVDKDPNALNIAKQNIKSLNLQNSILLKQEIQEFNKKVDTVIQNPPFGMQTPHADKPFLEKAFQTANTIYSIHKKESENFIKQIMPPNFEIKEIKQIKIQLKQTQKHHKKPTHNINTALFILKKK